MPSVADGRDLLADSSSRGAPINGVRFLFLNQYFPPDPAPTGVLFRELAEHFTAHGHAVECVAAQQDYRSGQQYGGRLVREVAALLRMGWSGMRRQRPDVVIAGTSPPGLTFVAALVARWHRARAVHWIMDLYPEIAVALGETRSGLLSKTVSRAMGWAYRGGARVVALDEDMAERVRSYGVEPAIVHPWVFESILAQPQPTVAASEPWTWIYSGNLGRAHEWQTLLEAQALLEKCDAKVTLLFQGGGPAWPAAQRRAQELGLRDCHWLPYTKEADLPTTLLRAQVSAVTQLPATRGCLWPSKLGLVLTLPRPIAWVGPTDGAIANELRRYPHAGIFAPGDARALADWLLTLREHPVTIPASALLDARAQRTRSLATWLALVANAGALSPTH
jgi:colanic acid biosynthesis glycosyl transferase WcaI